MPGGIVKARTDERATSDHRDVPRRGAAHRCLPTRQDHTKERGHERHQGRERAGETRAMQSLA